MCFLTYSLQLIFGSGNALILSGWSMDPDPGEQNDPQKVQKLHALNCWMFSNEG
jgi:hypothetical protein